MERFPDISLFNCACARSSSVFFSELQLTSSSGHTFALKPYHAKHESSMEQWRSQIEKQIMRFEAQSGQMAAVGELEDVSFAQSSLGIVVLVHFWERLDLCF